MTNNDDCDYSLEPVVPTMKKDHGVNNDDGTIRIDEEEEEDDLVGLLMNDEGDVRLQGLFHVGDGNGEDEESNDIGVTSGNDSRKIRILEKKKVIIHEDSILDCFHLAVASHNATIINHQPTIIIQGHVDDVAQAKSTTSSDSFRWRPPMLYATTAEADTADTSTGTLADWQPQPLDLPLWALALLRPSNESVSKQAARQARGDE